MVCQEQGILVRQGAVLQYDLDDNMYAEQGSITLWVKPDWLPGDTLRRIMLVENSPVFELHVDENATLVLAMFSSESGDKHAFRYMICLWDFTS